MPTMCSSLCYILHVCNLRNILLYLKGKLLWAQMIREKTHCVAHTHSGGQIMAVTVAVGEKLINKKLGWPQWMISLKIE